MNQRDNLNYKPELSDFSPLAMSPLISHYNE